MGNSISTQENAVIYSLSHTFNSLPGHHNFLILQIPKHLVDPSGAEPAAAATIEHKADCNQCGAASNDLDRKEGRARAIGRRHHGHDQCEKRHQEARPADQPADEHSARNESDVHLLTRCAAAKRREGGEHIQQGQKAQDEGHVDQYEIGFMDRGAGDRSQQHDRREYSLCQQRYVRRTGHRVNRAKRSGKVTVEAEEER